MLVESRCPRMRWTISISVAVFLLGLAAVAHGQWVIKSDDGNAQIKLGLLLQGRAESVIMPETGSRDAYATGNLYIRRARILMGGKISSRGSFFLETDAPGLGTRADSASKNFDPYFMQDFITTWNITPDHMIDGGLLLTPGTYQHLQSAVSLLATDYGPFSFLEAGPLQTKVGRDTGVQARGVLANKLIEYRVGAFQGIRGRDIHNPFRYAARVAIYPFQTASTGYFYSGTGFGKARALSIGAALDGQRDYQAIHGDVFFELPLASTDCVTLQADVSRYDGGDFLPGLGEQTIWMVEAGYTTLQKRFGAYLQISNRSYSDETEPRDSKPNAPGPSYVSMISEGGLIWWLDGHRQNLKLAWTRTGFTANKALEGNAQDSDPDPQDRITLQYQLSYF